MNLRLLTSASLLVCFSLTCLAQKKANTDTSDTVRLDARKPTLYLEFVVAGVCRHAESFTVLAENPCESTNPDARIDKFNAVWLRLVNNTRWAIEVDARNLFVPPIVGGFALHDKRVVSAVKDRAEVDLYYDVEAERGCDFHESVAGAPCKKIDVQAPLIPLRAISSPVFVPSGRSLIFAVKREYLAKYLSVFVLYKYEWETSEKNRSSFDEPRHRVYFSWFELQKAIGQPAQSHQ